MLVMSTIYINPNEKKLLMIKKIRIIKELELATLLSNATGRIAEPFSAPERLWLAVGERMSQIEITPLFCSYDCVIRR